ncbi:MAG: Asp-tRNA(Asn)/Glu-tRNA(Gln) amidotransferase subunit GatA [Patescibacteria group bacterium]
MEISKRPTIKEIHSLYRQKKATPTQVAQFFLDRTNQIDTTIKSCLRILDTRGLVEAKRCDDILESHSDIDSMLKQYPLFGIPYNLKDNILVEGEVATSASKIIQNYCSTYSATVYERLYEAGGILISQSNLDEWAVGSSTENSAFGASKNPFDLERVPGGSSGGPAANVGAGESVFSLGSDTGGSIRQPASFCDLVGLKPTYGTVPRYGVMPLASSLDQVGPLTNCVEDCELVFEVIQGKDIKDQTTTEKTQTKNPKKINEIVIGVPKEYFIDGIEPLIKERVLNIIQELKNKGATIKEVNLPLTKFGLAVYYTTMTVETASNLQRYDGIRYGTQFKGGGDFEQFFSIRNQNFGQEPKRRIMLGTFASSAGYYDAYYNKAMMVKEKMTKEFEIVFESCDLIIAPTTPEFPFKFGEKTNDIVKMYLSDVLVYSANLCKIPSISVPMGLINYENKPLPAGIQLIGKEFFEEQIFEIAKEIEKIVID